MALTDRAASWVPASGLDVEREGASRRLDGRLEQAKGMNRIWQK
jgi:hypothetical protein